VGWVTWLGLALLSIVAVGLAAGTYGSRRWSEGTRSLRSALEAAHQPALTARYDTREIEGLPAPVQRYFRAVLTDGQAVVSAITVDHSGTFNMSAEGEQWKPFTSNQRIVTRRPGFDWDARIMLLPGVPVHIHDAYVAGSGTLHGELLGLLEVVDMQNTTESARGELIRFFAEAAWYPTALLPSQGVLWEAVDGQSARATLTDGPTSVTMTFRFQDADGMIDCVRVESRGRMVGGKVSSVPWQGRFWDYGLRGGMRVPLQGEAAWLLPEGVKPYWRGTSEVLTYEFADGGH
jgi:hypothetical protein